MNDKKLEFKWQYDKMSLSEAVEEALDMSSANMYLDDNPQEVKIQIEVEKLPIRAEEYIYTVKVYSINENVEETIKRHKIGNFSTAKGDLNGKK